MKDQDTQQKSEPRSKAVFSNMEAILNDSGADDLSPRSFINAQKSRIAK